MTWKSIGLFETKLWSILKYFSFTVRKSMKRKWKLKAQRSITTLEAKQFWLNLFQEMLQDPPPVGTTHLEKVTNCKSLSLWCHWTPTQSSIQVRLSIMELNNIIITITTTINLNNSNKNRLQFICPQISPNTWENTCVQIRCRRRCDRCRKPWRLWDLCLETQDYFSISNQLIKNEKMHFVQ